MSLRLESSAEWREVLSRKLPLFGHRNWIVIADAAYPAQCAAGATTMFAGGEPLDVVRDVLAAIAAAEHVKAKVRMDRELRFVSERDAPGIDEFRGKIAELLQWSDVQTTPHEELIAMLDRAATTFEVLVIKTGLTLPYTSVFLELDCAYWNEGAEARLRGSMGE
jgi:L-fucose mutarotase/ribose pyranase (RbsD/FucU family)